MDEVRIARLLSSVEREERDEATIHRLKHAFIWQSFKDSEEVVDIDSNGVEEEDGSEEGLQETENYNDSDEIKGICSDTDFDYLENLPLQIRPTNNIVKRING